MRLRIHARAHMLSLVMREQQTAITRTRRSVSARLSGLELPACFAASTVAAAVNASERDTQTARSQRRRSISKALRVVSRGAL